MIETIEAPNPFDQPDLVQPRLSLATLLGLYRSRLNKGYMPSATGEHSYNAKPTYVNRRDEQFLTFPKVPFTIYGSGCYAFEGDFGKGPIFANLVVGHYQVLTNLTTLETLVRMKDDGPDGTCPIFHPFVRWKDESKTIPMDRFELAENIDTYL